ncbi:unnamed protein product [Allacma fusca]|uniref:Vacuolar fusion protein MON1 homolog n=1 Tax=Allacma fusca TaxID=39272 RepID=A0A8J2KJ09_9HEXA|nr:unnamed protein product [Allacma fusca]
MSNNSDEKNPKNGLTSSLDGGAQNGDPSVDNGDIMEIPVEPSSMDISGEGAKMFVTDAEEGEVPDGPQVSKLKFVCRDGSQGQVKVEKEDKGKVQESSETPKESGDNVDRKAVVTNEQDLVKALDELSVATSGSEDFKEAVTSNFRRQSMAHPEMSDEDFVTSSEWKNVKRHIFVLSEAGKPIYSRFGNEEQLATLFGLMQALVSFVQENKDMIRSVKVGQTNIVFLAKTPLILVCVSRLDECVAQTQNQLMYFYNQIVSILTSKQLFAIFEKRKNYDLRRLLSGSERLLDNLGNLVENDPSFVLGAVKCLPLTSSVRETISQTIIQNLSKTKNVVFAILIANNQLVSLVRMKKCFMHPMDLHIILNLIDSSESFKTAESWTPLCLPRFDSSGFVHAHVSYLADDCQACLVLLAVDRDSFFALSEAKQKIVERLRRHNCLEAINASMSNCWPTMSYVNVQEVRHFIYKSRSIAQFITPALDIPYVLPGSDAANNLSIAGNIQGHNVSPELQRIYSTYFKMHSRLHSHSRPLKLMYRVDDTENWIGWLTSSFELYVAFEPLVTKSAAIAAVNKLLKWVKKEEDRIFIMNSPTF